MIKFGPFVPTFQFVVGGLLVSFGGLSSILLRECGFDEEVMIGVAFRFVLVGSCLSMSSLLITCSKLYYLNGREQ